MQRPESTLSRRRLLGYGAAAGAGAAGLAGVRSPLRTLAQGTTSVRLALYNITDAWHSVFDEVIAGFNESNPEITVEVERRPGDNYWDKLQVEFASGTAPDIMLLNMDWVIPGAARGMFVDLRPLYERDGIDISNYWYPVDAEWAWNGAFYGGLLYAGGQALYVNKDLLAAAGLPFPAPDWTWDDLLSYARAMTDPGNNQYGVDIAPINPPYWSSSFIHGAGGTVLNDARDQCTLTTPEARAGLQFIADLILKEQVMPTPGSFEGQENPFLTGKIGLYFGGTWDEVAIRSAEFDWDFAHMPVNPATGIRMVQRDSNAWGILSSSEKQEAAWEVIKYLIGPEAQRGLMVLGVPVLREVVEDPAFREAHAPQNIDVVISDLAEIGHDLYPTPDAAEWWNAIDQELSVIWNGEATVDEATDRACQAIDEIFARRPAEWSS